jgi:mannose-6-phosphate isomerase-like protein (cupin superfamily)
MKLIFRTLCVAVAAACAQPTLAQDSSAAPLATQATDAKLKWGPCPPIFSGDCNIAVLNGDPAKPNADVFLRIGGGMSLPVHRHSSAERMILVSGRFRVDYRGAPPVTLVPGNYAYGPAGLPHRAVCLGKQRCTLFIAFEGPVDAMLDTSAVD